MRFFSLGYIYFICFNFVSAQVTLEQTIALAQQNSPVARQIRATTQGNYWRFQAAKGALRPQLIGEGTVPGYARQIGQVQQPDGTFLFRSYSRSASSVSLSLAQSVLATGGTVRLTTGLSRIDVFGINRTLLWATTPFALVFTQPLFRLNQVKWDWQQQQLIFRHSSRQQAEMQEDLSVVVAERFFAVGLAFVQLRNAESNRAINDTLARIAKVRYEAGRIAESDWLQVELSLLNARNACTQYKAQLRTAEQSLNTLLGVQVTTLFQPESLKIPPDFHVDPDRALVQARLNRSDRLAYEITENQALLTVQSAQTARQFNADLTASVGFNQSAGSLSQAYQQLVSAQSFSINFKLPLYTAGRNRALLEAAKSDLTATQAQIQIDKNSFDLDILNQVNSLNQFKNSLSLVTLADTIARKRFQDLRERYQIGKTDITTLTFAQQEKDNALVSYLKTLQDFWVAYYRLRRLTLYDFIGNQTLVSANN